MQLYPVFLSLAGRACLVIGSGPEAIRRAQGLIKSHALVTLAADNGAPVVADIHQTVRWTNELDDLNDYWLVVAASDDPAVNERIASGCDERRIFCYVVKNRTACSFILPAIVDRSPLLIAITSGGAAPALARALKTKLETLIPSAYARLANIVSRHQRTVKQRIPHNADRALFWHHFLNGPVGELAFSQDESAIERSLERAVENSSQNAAENMHSGFVSLVGAGPGDPDLLTFRALRLIQAADVIVYDRLVSQAILELRRHNARMIYAGKAKSKHTLPQPSINQLLVDLAQQGLNVVRLKGGDPFIFGRGGEEIETLSEHKVPFQVVPGITAASGCAAFAGIPLTHRDYAQSCVFVTGHLQNGEINLKWNDLRDPTQTIVVYMGLTGLPGICKKLIETGRAADTPAALIEQGTTPDQRVHVGTLGSLPALIDTREVQAPTLLIIGGVVSLRESLSWFETTDKIC